MQRFDAVLFDLDGTLIDSAPGIFDSLAYTVALHGLTPPSPSQMRKYLGPPVRDNLRDLLPEALVEQAVKEYRARYAKVGLINCTLYAGIEKMLQRLHANGYVIATATSKPQVVAQATLSHFGVDGLFDVIGGASLDAGLDTKAKVIQNVLAAPALAGRRAVMVGDRSFDLEGARVCSLPAVAVLYGYGCAEEFAPYQPLYTAQNAEDLGDWLLRHFRTKEAHCVEQQ